MPKNVVNNRFLVLFLLLSFMLISFAIIPATVSISCADTASDTQQSNSGSSSSLSLGDFNCFDYLYTENISFIIGSSQSFQTRRLIEEGCESLSSAIPYAFSLIPFAALSFQELSRLFCSNKITEFMHAKDGMI